jgi:thiamine biosynthesis protein ThiS
MELFMEKTGENKKMKFSGSVASLLAKLKQDTESVIVVKNNTVVTEDEEISETDKVKILSVISGG